MEKVEHTLYMKHLGPIEECEIGLNDFTVLTGPQSNGKSTVAKAIYWARTLKQDVIEVMRSGGPAKYSLGQNTMWEDTIRKKLRDKFLNIFGTSWIMPTDMTLRYTFCENTFVEVTLSPDYQHPGKNFVQPRFSENLTDFFSDLDQYAFYDVPERQRKQKEEKVSKILNDPFDTVFIPAGRNMITLLSEQLTYIFSSMDSMQLRNIDYVTGQYVTSVSKLKPSFRDGMSGYMENLQNAPNLYINYKQAARELMRRSEALLHGVYRYVDGEERLYIDEKRYVKINFASSGQQEIVWILNILFYNLVLGKRIFLILEEPESHLYPDAQQAIGEILGLFGNCENKMLITTHSPYLLGTFNYMLQAGQCAEGAKETVKEKLHRRYWLDPEKTSAYHVHDGTIASVIDRDDALILITDEVIDDASLSINEIGDFIMEQNWKAGGGND